MFSPCFLHRILFTVYIPWVFRNNPCCSLIPELPKIKLRPFFEHEMNPTSNVNEKLVVVQGAGAKPLLGKSRSRDGGLGVIGELDGSLPVKSWTTSTQDTPDFKIPFGLNLIHTLSTHDRAHPLDSMHRCLYVDEILRLIACELVTSRTGATAVCLACCCRGFEDPVLDALWTTQFELSPLFKCFPGDVWNEGRCKVSTTTTHVLSFSQRFGSKVFQTTPDGDGMGSFPEVRSKNAKVQIPWHPGDLAFGGLFCHATLHN